MQEKFKKTSQRYTANADEYEKSSETSKSVSVSAKESFDAVKIDDSSFSDA